MHHLVFVMFPEQVGLLNVLPLTPLTCTYCKQRLGLNAGEPFP